MNRFTKLTFGLLILTIFLISGCVNTNEPAQKTQPQDEPIGIGATQKTQQVITSTSTVTTKIINIHPQYFILDDNDIKDVLGTDWKRDYDNPDVTTENYVRRMFVSEPIVGSKGGSIYYGLMIQLFTYGSINEAKEKYSERQKLGWQNKGGGQKVNIGDFGSIYTGDGVIQIYFVKNNIVSDIFISRAQINPFLLSEAEKNQMINILKVDSLAKKQEEKISRILDVIK